MTELTKEYFDEVVKHLVTKDDVQKSTDEILFRLMDPWPRSKKGWRQRSGWPASTKSLIVWRRFYTSNCESPEFLQLLTKSDSSGTIPVETINIRILLLDLRRNSLQSSVESVLSDHLLSKEKSAHCAIVVASVSIRSSLRNPRICAWAAESQGMT